MTGNGWSTSRRGPMENSSCKHNPVCRACELTSACRAHCDWWITSVRGQQPSPRKPMQSPWYSPKHLPCPAALRPDPQFPRGECQCSDVAQISASALAPQSPYIPGKWSSECGRLYIAYAIKGQPDKTHAKPREILGKLSSCSLFFSKTRIPLTRPSWQPSFDRRIE